MSFEATCARAESVAIELDRVAKQLQRAARAMAKAAGEGNHSKAKQATDQIRQVAAQAASAAGEAQTAWPLTDAYLTAQLESTYEAELVDAASRLGVSLTRLDDRLAAFPVVVQLQPAQRALRIDSTRVANLRPSAVARRIQQRMSKARSRPEQFLEILFKAYRLIVGDPLDRGCLLLDVYDALTLLPDSRKAYERADFARDVYLLDSSDARVTKSGATVSFPAATGTKGGGKAITVVTESGMPKYYYGVRFTQGAI